MSTANATGAPHNGETHIHLRSVLKKLGYPEDPSELPADFYDELKLEARQLARPHSTTPPPPTNVLPKAQVEGTSKSRRVWKCPLMTSDPACTMRTFTRAADCDRHILSSHLSITVLCTHCAHNSPARLSRPDAVPRHMSKPCCLGKAKYSALKRKYARQLGVDPEGWKAKSAVHQKYIRIRMPCYQRENVKSALAALGTPRTVKDLEERLSGYGKIERCRCALCRRVPQPQPMPPQATMGKGDGKRRTTSAAGSKRPRRKATVEDETERLPPEEEEGVDEDDPSESSQTVESEHASGSSYTIDGDDTHASATEAASDDEDEPALDNTAVPMENTAPDAIAGLDDDQQYIQMHTTQTADLEDMLECDPTWGSGAVTSMP